MKNKFKDHLELLLVGNKDKSQNVYVKNFDRFICNQTKHVLQKNVFVWTFYNDLAVKKYWYIFEKFT